MGSAKESTAGTRHGFEYVEGWGMSHGAHARVWRPENVEQVRSAMAAARSEARSLALRGSGCSYGDASVNSPAPNRRPSRPKSRRSALAPNHRPSRRSRPSHSSRMPPVVHMSTVTTFGRF